ncbi:MAG: ROK family protein [Akkermansiaceae bacterium]|nr:ROK family protein [Akkermansiaceae bacterium]MCP5551535.1 ROK family protein [Akkermansiaceae bacterium]
MNANLPLSLKCPPPLEPGFVPAALWNRAFRGRVRESGDARPFGVALEQPDGAVSVYRTEILPETGPENAALNTRFATHLVKFLLWQRGGHRVFLGGSDSLTREIAAQYSPEGARAFDHRFMGEKAYRASFEIVGVPFDDLPEPRETAVELGGHLDGCRIGFDLGGSDRKAAAVVEGEVVFSEEVPWDPYFQSDPQYHLDGIRQSLEAAAAHLPRVDAIGGSAAGVYVNNEVRVGSLFRGVPDDVFDQKVRRMFFDLQAERGGVPFVIVNDGDVTALAGSMATGDTGVLGVAMGTSEAVGFVTPGGHITTWLNELAFAPIDYQENAPADEWSGGPGVGAQYLSQQAVGRLAARAGYAFPDEMGLPGRLVAVQKAMEAGEPGAAKIFETVGRYFGYAVAHYADFYDIRQILALGRVTSGAGGDLLLREAKNVLATEFPGLAEKIQFRQPGEKEKRHGQAIAAASLPALS